MPSKYPQLAAFITKHRERAGLSVPKLAEQIGVTRQTVHYWEAGDVLPQIAVLEPLAQAIGSSYEELFTRAGYDLKTLPQPEPYLRTVYPNASARDMKEAKRLFERMDAAQRRKKGKRS
jgi:transcriptional regulator with XRE-family HTH domain